MPSLRLVIADLSPVVSTESRDAALLSLVLIGDWETTGDESVVIG